MSNSTEKSLAPAYFEAVYENAADPWNFATSAYEAEKYAATIAALSAGKYAAAFEIGCSIGVLTAQLAAKCESLLAVDVSEKALAQARQRCAEYANVTIRQMRVPDEFPERNFDLIVVSEVGYYLNAADWRVAQTKIFAHLNSGGTIILVHWTHFVHDYPQTGDAVHDSFADFAAKSARHLTARKTADYRLDVWEKL